MLYFDTGSDRVTSIKTLPHFSVTIPHTKTRREGRDTRGVLSQKAKEVDCQNRFFHFLSKMNERTNERSQKGGNSPPTFFVVGFVNYVLSDWRQMFSLLRLSFVRFLHVRFGVTFALIWLGSSLSLALSRDLKDGQENLRHFSITLKGARSHVQN